MAALLLVGCEERPTELSNQVNSTAPARSKQAVLPQPDPPLDRERLLLAVVRARSAHAVGADDHEDQAELDGARFELRIRFGCGAPAAQAPLTNPTVRHDVEGRTIQLRAVPDVDLADPIVAAFSRESVEAVEGFWIPRPWILHPTCPPDQATSAALGPEKVGIAQFFTSEDSRVGRRDERAYSTTVRLENEQDPARPQGYDLLLSGRLRAGPEGRVIRCLSPDPNAIPACLISVEFDRVRVDDVAAASTLAEWRRG